MPLKDYEHWNEDAQYMWWHEEGKHGSEEPPYDPDDYLPNDDIVECTSPEDCNKNGCFSLPTKTGQWECDICGRRARENEEGLIVADWIIQPNN